MVIHSNILSLESSSDLERAAEIITARERDVLKLVAAEYSTKEIAHLLYVSVHTIVSHRKRLMEKWKVKNTAGLVRIGFRSGVLQ